MIHVVATIANTIWFFLTGLLWYAKPAAEIWFVCSLVLGLGWFYAFFRYVTHPFAGKS